MSLDGISNKVGVSSLEGSEVDMRSAARDLNKPTKRCEENAVSNFIGGAGQSDGPTAEQAFDLLGCAELLADFSVMGIDEGSKPTRGG